MTLALWPLGLGVLGAILGSFIAALAIRWPEGRSVMRGRSACDACGATLTPHELVPVVSYVVQRGRCRRCGARIDPWHPGVELAGVAIGVLAGFAAPGWDGMAGAVFGWLLLALAALDVRAFWLPDRLTGLLAVTGLAAGLAGVAPVLDARLIGGIAGYGSLAAIAWGYRRWRGRDGMGGGDPKLMGAIGLWLGWRMLPAVLVIASLIGLGVALFARVRGAKVTADMPLPFGALLAIAAYAAWLAMIAFAA
ncbi:prepilin peptidase [Sphingomonas aquatilis]|uniref:Prepilin leader peptidase/N-methyltransferase n=1 Tax=Sphingomonas aquatilis TaxID=93063 RepID=A0AAW3TNS6_9SPHN|nr:A24 family peptidase [Sphingomonas aquatilis]MBB3874642.1 leader peptidase (prepilin peptidase)/N-methyltransferase [Sphingomonas aquatilis]MCI4655020.1 A24 family peptidase [Sphingomonas aquatilis]GEM70641.1 type 4 prepilin-like proteins leader peptide-processing enzyme [Sphingomonas aquatilis NBRC 16722]